MPDHHIPPQVPAGAPAPATRLAWSKIGRLLAPRATRAQIMAFLLCVLLGFAFVTQVRSNQGEGLATLSQEELVRILDDTTRRTSELEAQAAELRAQRAELVSGSDTQRAAQEAAERRAAVQGVLAGVLPATGPGIVLTIEDPDVTVGSLVMFNILEELRNAGVEAVELDGVRLVASSWFLDGSDGVIVDSTALEPPYVWVAIGDPDTITPALSMPGGALAGVRNAGGTSELEAFDEVAVEAVVDLVTPGSATPLPLGEG